MNQQERNAMDAVAGILFIAALLLIFAQGIYLAYKDRINTPPTNLQCWSILHDGQTIEPFTAEDCLP